jgi:hypothetical protein
MDYELICEAATSAPVITGAAVDACTAAGGTVAWVEVSSVLPDLSIEGGGLIALAILTLWALAWTFRQLSQQIKES